jgi:hypothetical protein
LTETPETSDIPEAPENPETSEISITTELPLVLRRRSPLRRAGCIVALVIWFALLLLPCFLIVLAVQQEIIITTGSVPGQQTRLWLISEAEERGLAISTASIRQSDENAVCVETDVHFMLWAGKADPTSYCDCYQRANASVPWSQASTASGACTG